MTITKPLLAAKKPVFENIKFPVLATPKIDGIRCLVIDGKALSRSFKPIPNVHIRTMIEKYCPNGFDGEIICGDGFNDVQSLVMTREGTPDFQYLVFDYVQDGVLDTPYIERVQELHGFFKQNPLVMTCAKALVPVMINSLEELHDQIDKDLLDGFEGTMIRSPQSPYKCGRASLKEGYLTAIKHFVDDEAVIYGMEELMHNDNEATRDAFGHTERSSHKENKRPAGTLGKFLVRHADGTEFKIGTFKGLTAPMKQDIWNNKDKYIGKIAHYRYQPHGVKDKPRIPSFYGFRDPEDMST